jgi:hypothetical protein
MPFTDNIFVDLLIVGIATVVTLFIYKIISSIIKRTKKVSQKRKLILRFSFRLIVVLILVYLLIEGLPFFQTLPAEYVAIITSSVSVAIAFASSGIFENLVSGIALIILNPFELDDIVTIGDAFGAVREIRLTKTIIETFDNIFIEISNSDVISAKIVKYSLKLENIKDFVQFRKKVSQAEQEGSSPIVEGDLERNNELRLRKIFDTAFKRKENPKIHNFTFTMEFYFPQFRKKLEKVDQLCEEYEEKFGFKPRYHISGLYEFIKVTFRLITFDSNKFFKYQPEFAKRLYRIVQK